jgi:protein-S-isoprenylcysteine O-methyltransferase Ste14
MATDSGPREYPPRIYWLLYIGLWALLIAAIVALIVRWEALEPWPLYVYAALLTGYLVVERRVRRSPTSLGRRWHEGLRYLLSASWFGLILGAPLEYALWPRNSVPVTLLGASLAFAGSILRVWAVAALGRYYSGHIETWESQQVVTAGPYRVIRHPAYAGNMLQALGFPLVLDAYASLGLAALVIALFVQRLLLEDETLAAELPGYREYQRRTWRLIPGVW